MNNVNKCKNCYGCNKQEDKRFVDVDDCIDYQEAIQQQQDKGNKKNVNVNYKQIKM